MTFGSERSEAAKGRTRGNVTACVRGSIYNFFFEGRKMSFCGPYRGHKILNVFCGLGLIFSISRPLYGLQKFILRPEDKKETQDDFGIINFPQDFFKIIRLLFVFDILRKCELYCNSIICFDSYF